MLRRTAFIAVPAALAVSGCSALGNLTGYLSPAQQAIVDQIQQGIIKACSYAPTVQSILSLVSAFSAAAGAGAGLVNAVIQAVCDAMPAPTPPAGIAAAAMPRLGQTASFTVNGVAVTGIYTR